MTKIIHGKVSSFNTPPKHRSFNLRYFNALLFTTLLGLGVFYLVLINNLTVQGFVLQKLTTQVTNLSNTNMNIQEQLNAAQSFPAVNARLPKLHLVAANDVQYLAVHGSIVAKR